MADVAVGGVLERRRVEMAEVSVDEGRNWVLDEVTYPDKQMSHWSISDWHAQGVIEAMSGVSDNCSWHGVGPPVRNPNR
jgi:hypothetical protein